MVGGRHLRFPLKNASEVILRSGFLARLPETGAKIARKYQKSSRNLKKMLPAPKNRRDSHPAFIYLYRIDCNSELNIPQTAFLGTIKIITSGRFSSVGPLDYDSMAKSRSR
jgi:hypothetical protein